MALCGPSGHNQQGPAGIFLVLASYWALGFFLVFPRMENDDACMAFRVIHSIFGVGVLISLIGVHLADPGILPVGVWNAETHAVLRGPIAMQFKKVVDPVTGEESELKFCTHCLIWRPPRAAHCYTCDRCVARFDHHCPVLGACIAQRTYRFFLGVLFFASLGGLLLFIGSIWWLVVLHPRNNDVWHHWPAYIALLSLISTLYLGGVTGFLGMHCFLLCEQKTTKEQFGRNGGGRRTCCFTSRPAWNEFCMVVMCAPVNKRSIWGESRTKIVQTTPMISHNISALIELPADVKVMNADGTPMTRGGAAAGASASAAPPAIPPSGPYATATSGPVRSMGIHESLMLAMTSPASSSASSSTAAAVSASSSNSSTSEPITLSAPSSSMAPLTSVAIADNNNDNNDDVDESLPLSATPMIWHDGHGHHGGSNSSNGNGIPLTSIAITGGAGAGGVSSAEPISVTLHTSSATGSASADTPEEPLLSRADRVV